MCVHRIILAHSLVLVAFNTNCGGWWNRQSDFCGKPTWVAHRCSHPCKLRMIMDIMISPHQTPNVPSDYEPTFFSFWFNSCVWYTVYHTVRHHDWSLTEVSNLVSWGLTPKRYGVYQQALLTQLLSQTTAEICSCTSTNIHQTQPRDNMSYTQSVHSGTAYGEQLSKQLIHHIICGWVKHHSLMQHSLIFTYRWYPKACQWVMLMFICVL